MLISIVIPVYNSRVLDTLVGRIRAAFIGLADTCEIVLVDDCSPDPEVWPALVRLAQADACVRAIQLTRNFGQHAATLCGLREARGDFVITMDDDLEHRPEDIPRFLAMREHDVVIAQFRDKNHDLAARAGSRVKGTFDALILGKPKNIQLTSYRMLSRVVVDGVLAIRTAHPFFAALMLHVSKDIAGLPLEHGARPHGRSNYTLRRRLRLFTDLIIHNSSLVLRLVGQIGLAMSALSGLMAAYIVYRKLAHSIGVVGWTSLLTAQLLIGGLLLFSVGVVGEYLVRIIESSEARPTYYVRRRTPAATPAPTIQ
jgi:dolichol-phosphate mannosyltransferase/undecaprenyl-phosphate 4-deoxy-4-formamido-L-arabinose transferase